MVARDDQQVALPQHRQQLAQRFIKVFQRMTVAFHIPAMAVKHIKVDQIDEQQSLKIALHQFQRALLALIVAMRKEAIRDAAAGKDVRNLAHCQHFLPRRADGIQHSGSCGFQ